MVWLPYFKEVKIHMETKNRTFTVFSMRLAGYLMLQGFVLEDIAPNRKTPDKRVFFFKDGDEIQEAIATYLLTHKR